MREDIKKFISDVQKPGKYTGGETGSVFKDLNAVDLRVAFCFPDTYEIGMSNLGMRILCGVLNEMPNVWCERVFAPWIDMEQKMCENNVPLYTHESGDNVRDFDIIGITLQYELCYSTALNMLDLAGVPIRADQRDDSFPIVLAGGPCSYNPEPMADFVDIFSIGEGEEALPELAALYIKMKKEGSYSKSDFLREASHINGFYVPSLYDIKYNEDNTIKSITPKHADVPEKVTKRIISDLDKVYFPTNPIIPIVETVHDRIVLEVFRGCIRGCRFCQAGYVTRPVREKSPELLNKQAKEISKNTGYDEISMCCLSVSDYSKVNTFTDNLLEWTDDEKINISFPSLRADSFTDELMSKISSVRTSTLTFAPEAGSQRLRDVINKNVTEEEILRACGVAFRAGKNQVKLYFMNGLPFENDEDILGIAKLAKSVINRYFEIDDRSRKKQPQVTLSVACFIPKPFTAFQWERQNTAEELEYKQKLLMSAITDRKIRYNYHDAKVSRLEAVFARGSRLLGKALEMAVKENVRFDAWEEMFDYDKWLDIFEKTSIDPAFYANREIPEDEVLPWDMIDCGVSKSFLLNEKHKAAEAATTPSCKEKCSGCGVNKLVDKEYCRWCPGHVENNAEYLGKNISHTRKSIIEPSGKRDARGAGAAVNPSKKPVKVVKLRFEEKDELVYVSHLDINRVFLRAMLRSKLPIYYTEGFNPIPKLTFASSLSVGCGGENELAQIKFVEDVSEKEVFEKLAPMMPPGIVLKEVYSSDTSLKEIKWATNTIQFSKCYNDLEMLKEYFSKPVVVVKKTKSKEKEVDITTLIKSIGFSNNDVGLVCSVMTSADCDNYLNPSYVAKAILRKISEKLEINDIFYVITRNQFYFENGEIFR